MRMLLFNIAIVALACTAADGAFAQSGRHPKPAPTQQEEKHEQEKGRAGDDGRSAVRAEEGEVSSRSEVTQKAVITYKPEPRYPRGARKYNVQGRVVLKIILGSDGKVADKISVIESLPYGLTEEAIKAARKIKFVPARKDERPVSQYLTVEYHFHIY